MTHRRLPIFLGLMVMGMAIPLRAGDTAPEANTATEIPAHEVPEWLRGKIQFLATEPVANPPTRIIRFRWREKTVYYQPPQCCDVESTLWDEHGQFLCSPDGGITGRGDGKCAGFGEEYTEETIIWMDKRSR